MCKPFLCYLKSTSTSPSLLIRSCVSKPHSITGLSTIFYTVPFILAGPFFYLLPQSLWNRGEDWPHIQNKPLLGFLFSAKTVEEPQDSGVLFLVFVEALRSCWSAGKEIAKKYFVDRFKTYGSNTQCILMGLIVLVTLFFVVLPNSLARFPQNFSKCLWLYRKMFQVF